MPATNADPTEPPSAPVQGAGSTGPGGSPEPGPGPDQAATHVADPAAIVGNVISAAADGVHTVVKPRAAAAVATSFGFPLALMLLVVLFLLVQPRLDRRDPKLRAAQDADGSMVGFEEEDRL